MTDARNNPPEVRGYPWLFPPFYSEALDVVPDGWAKVRGRWVELERPRLNKNAYDLVEADWATLNEALVDGRIRILPLGANCVCDPSTGAVCGLHARQAEAFTSMGPVVER